LVSDGFLLTKSTDVLEGLSIGPVFLRSQSA
jgi:hypothetical protein